MIHKNQRQYPNDDYSRFSGPDYRESDSKEPGRTINLGNFKFHKEEYGRFRDGELPWRIKEKNHFGKGPKGYRRSDNMIYEDVCEALWRDSEVDAGEIEVSVKEGIVNLAGTVTSREDKKRAEWIAESVAGVRDIFNQLRFHQLEGWIPGIGQAKDDMPLQDVL